MCQMVTRVFIDHNLWPEFTIWRLMWFPPLFCSFVLLFATGE
jgi:hypothetical protein